MKLYEIQNILDATVLSGEDQLDRNVVGAGGADLMADVLSAVANFERQRISERTREALAEVRARGVQLGRPRVLLDEVVERIEEERAEGQTFQAMADGLNKDGVPTAHGGRQWWPSTVRAVVGSAQKVRRTEG